MAADRGSVGKLNINFKEKNGLKKAENNNFPRKENSKDLLKVCPEREFNKYLLVNKDKKVSVQRKTFKPSECQALKQVKDFLPMMKQAQEELSNTDHNMESIDEDGPCINMDIQLVELGSENTSSDSDCGEETDSDIDLGEITETNLVLKKPEKIKKPMIEDIT